MKKMLFLLPVLSLSFALALPAAAATPAPERYAGQQPEALLKTAPEFARAFRNAVRDLELPQWTKRLAAGTPAEVVDIGGKPHILTSACSQQGCHDERLYILFDVQAKKASGIFFLPPSRDNIDDMRVALSQWYGKPSKEASNFLMERAMQDAHAAAQAVANPATLQ